MDNLVEVLAIFIFLLGVLASGVFLSPFVGSALQAGGILIWILAVKEEGGS